MELTAGKLRAAAWLQILSIIPAVVLAAVEYEIKSSGAGESAGFSKMLLDGLWALLHGGIVVYALIIFRLVLNEWFEYKELDSSIKYLVGLYIVYAVSDIGLAPLKGTVLPKYVSAATGFLMMVLSFDISRTLLKKPVGLFGYGRKLAVSSMTVFVCSAVSLGTIAVGLCFAGFHLPNLKYLPTLFFVPAILASIGTVVIGIYLFVIELRMFFVAAWAMEAGYSPAGAMGPTPAEDVGPQPAEITASPSIEFIGPLPLKDAYLPSTEDIDRLVVQGRVRNAGRERAETGFDYSLENMSITYLTASKLRIAGWMVILAAVLGIADIFASPLTKYSGAGASMGVLHNMWGDAYLLISSAIIICLLLVFRLLLNELFAYKKLDMPLNLLLLVYLFYPIFTMDSSAFSAALWPVFARLIFGLLKLILYLIIIFALLKKPIHLFGYSKKLAVSLLAVVICMGTAAAFLNFHLIWFIASNTTPGGGPGLQILIVWLLGLAAFAAGVYFIVILTIMFFAAARAVEAAGPPEALASD